MLPGGGRNLALSRRGQRDHDGPIGGGDAGARPTPGTRRARQLQECGWALAHPHVFSPPQSMHLLRLLKWAYQEISCTIQIAWYESHVYICTTHLTLSHGAISHAPPTTP